MWGGGGELLTFYTGHKEVNVALNICGKCFHKLEELWIGCHVDVTVKGVVFISIAEWSAGTLFPGGLGVSSQLDVQSMVGASKSEGAWAEV